MEEERAGVVVEKGVEVMTVTGVEAEGAANESAEEESFWLHVANADRNLV